MSAQPMSGLHSSSEHRRIAEQGTILQGTIGSTVHGLNLPDGEDDDQMGICVEPPQYVAGLREFDQYIYRSAEERGDVPTSPEQQQPRSQRGDLDLTVFSARKWCRLAVAGNPNALLLLFIPATSVSVINEWGNYLRSRSKWFVSQTAGRAFLNYARQQRQRLLGDIGQLRVTRSELVDAYGFDVKYAYHALRVAHQGIEFMRYGYLIFPMVEPMRSYILSVRRGEVTLDEVTAKISEMESELTEIIRLSLFREEADVDSVNEFLVDLHLSTWRRTA